MRKNGVYRLLKPMRRRSRDKYKKIPLNQIDIRGIFDNLGIPYTEKGKNVSHGWIGVTCPFCDDLSNHLGIHLKTGTCSCFKCGETGTIIKYLSEKLNSFNKAIQVLENSIPRELRSLLEERKKEKITRVNLPKEAKRQITPYHAGYLHSRNFDYKKVTEKYNLHFCGPVGDWANRIIVPIINNYRLVTFTSVDISDETRMRYKHLKAEKSVIPVKEYLFGLEHTDGHSCCLTEGLFDQFRIGSGAVCSFGVKLTPKQIKLLSKFKRVLICFDGDETGRKGANKIANDISVFCDVEILNLPEGTDPDKLSKDDIEFIRSKIGKN